MNEVKTDIEFQEQNFLTGVLKAWNPIRGFGFVEIPTKTLPVQRFYLHITAIKDGPTNPPLVNSVVRFRTKPAKKIGFLPLAVDATVMDLNDLGKRMPEAQ